LRPIVIQIVRKLEMRTRSWRREVVGQRSFEDIPGGLEVSSSRFEYSRVSCVTVAGVAILNGKLSGARRQFLGI